MGVFSDYAHYYNLIYHDKDYAGEADYIATLIKEFSPNSQKILELGSGTGRHAALLARKGYHIHGLELSEEMLQQARPLAVKDQRLLFSQGDIRTARLNTQFDVVISLFHVMSYQTTNDDLQAAFRTAAQHLRPGGIFIFDCWYGPAVLTDKPSVRIKRVSDDQIEVTRLAEPVMHPNQNLVDVNYHVFVRDKATREVHEIRETHHMRYLFQPEIELLLHQTGFQLIHAEEWMTHKQIGYDTWSACFMGQVE